MEDLYHKAGVHPNQIPTMTISRINSILVQHNIRPLLVPKVGSDEWDDPIPEDAVVAALVNQLGYTFTAGDIGVIEAAYPALNQISHQAIAQAVQQILSQMTSGLADQRVLSASLRELT